MHLKLSQSLRGQIRQPLIARIRVGLSLFGMFCVVLPLSAAVTLMVAEFAWSKQLMKHMPPWLNHLCEKKSAVKAAAVTRVKNPAHKIHEAISKH
jgi:hypothetical protein